MGRRDYEDDPDAPAANSLVPAASAVVVDSAGRILLQRRADNGMWALPGGAMNLGESLPDCAVRETREETGYDIELTGIVGTYTNPGACLRIRRRRGPAGVLRLLPRPAGVGPLGGLGGVHGRPMVRAVRGRRPAHGAVDPEAGGRLARRRRSRPSVRAEHPF